MSDQINRVVLAYSGGLDTSVILKWLQQTYDCEVVTFTADLGQGEELEPVRGKAQMAGVKPEHIFIDDLKEEFVRDFVFPMMKMCSGLTPAICALPRTGSSSSPCPRSAVKVTTSH